MPCLKSLFYLRFLPLYVIIHETDILLTEAMIGLVLQMLTFLPWKQPSINHCVQKMFQLKTRLKVSKSLTPPHNILE